MEIDEDNSSTALSKAIELIPDAIRESICNAFIDDLNTMVEDSVGMVQGNLRSISLR